MRHPVRLQLQRSARARPGRRLAAALAALAAASSALGSAAGAGRFTLTSPDILPGGTIARSHVYDREGCGGGNLSPALSWSHPPAGTRSFALLMYDPDAPTGHGWWHWVVFDLPARARSLRVGAGNSAQDALPGGALETRNDFGSWGYGGPCPPPGAPHHYRIMLYALSVPKLGLAPVAGPARIAAAVRAHEIAMTEIVALYGR